MTCRDINELTPLAQKACRLFLKKCGEEGLRVFITETYRSQARQNSLYAQGRTTPGLIVTWTKSSRHTSRRAWDIACIGKDLYDTVTLKKAGYIAKQLGITWGGDWETIDRPHFEITEDWEEPEEYVMRYNNIDEVPEWGKATIQKLIKNGFIADEKALDLSNDMLRTFVILDRNGTFKEVK